MILLLLLQLLTFVICQETANYKEEKIVMRKLIYITFVISYAILLLDFIILSHVQFWIQFQFWYYIYSFSMLFVIYMFIVITIVFIQDHIHCLHSVCIHHSVIYSSMQLSFVLNIIFLIHCITFNISYLITIFNICCCYSWDLSLYLYSAYYLIFFIIFTFICTWYFFILIINYHSLDLLT